MPTVGRSRPRRDRPWRSRRLSVGIGVWLIALAIVPLVGAGWFAVAESRDASRACAQANAIEGTVHDLVAVTELRARVIDEKNWVSVSAGIVEIGLTVDLVESFTNFDIAGEQARAVASVDEATDGVRLSCIGAALLATRQGTVGDLDELVDSYDRLDVEVGATAAQILDGLLRTASGIDDGADLVDAVRVLESAGIARQSMASQVTQYFGAQFALVASASEELERLIEQRELRRRAVGEIERLAQTGGAASAALQLIEASPSQQLLDTAAGGLVSATLDVGTTGADLSPASLLADIDAIATVFAAGTDPAQLHLQLVASAGTDVTAASQLLSSRADSATDRVAVIIGLLATASLLFTLGLAQAMGGQCGASHEPPSGSEMATRRASPNPAGHERYGTRLGPSTKRPPTFTWLSAKQPRSRPATLIILPSKRAHRGSSVLRYKRRSVRWPARWANVKSSVAGWPMRPAMMG